MAFYYGRSSAFMVLLALSVTMASVQFKRLCQNRMLDISCQHKNEVLVIKGALFGRTRAFTKECGYQSTAMCIGRETSLIAAGTCAGRHACTLYASTGVFGNPCKAIYKYLEVSYECVPRDTLVSVCDHDHLDLKAGDRGFVHSPSYPAKYNSGATCRLTMEAPHGTDVILTLLHANFPDGNTCSHDSLVIAGDETTPDQICADMALPKHYDFGNVTITFKIDRMQNFAADHPALAKGFILQYEVKGCAMEELALPNYGVLKSVQYGRSAAVGCEDGFRSREGADGECICQHHKWMCEPVVCRPIPCYIEYLEIPDNMMRSLVDEGRRVLLRCKPGNRPVNGTLGQIDCVKGNWTGEIGACVAEECSPEEADIPQSVKAFVSPDQKHIHFRCRGRYQPQNGTLGQLVCHHGNWTGHIGECVETPLTSPVAFTAQLSDRSVAIEAGEPIPFDNMLTNLGSAFYPAERLFEVPANGTYWFSWTVTGLQTDAVLSIVRGTEVLTEGWVSGTRAGVTVPISGQITLSLTETENIWLQLRPANQEQFFTYPTGGIPNTVPVLTFSGFSISNN